MAEMRLEELEYQKSGFDPYGSKTASFRCTRGFFFFF